MIYASEKADYFNELWMTLIGDEEKRIMSILMINQIFEICKNKLNLDIDQLGIERFPLTEDSRKALTDKLVDNISDTILDKLGGYSDIDIEYDIEDYIYDERFKLFDAWDRGYIGHSLDPFHNIGYCVQESIDAKIINMKLERLKPQYTQDEIDCALNSIAEPSPFYIIDTENFSERMRLANEMIAAGDTSHITINREDVPPKYELVYEDTISFDEISLYRIRALRDFSDVKQGQLGGYVESEMNLSHLGDCWVYDNANVLSGSIVSDNAKIYGSSAIDNNSVVCGNAIVYDMVHITDNSIVSQNAIVGMKHSRDDALSDLDFAESADYCESHCVLIAGDSVVGGNARIFCGRVVFGSKVIGNAVVVMGDIGLSSLVADNAKIIKSSTESDTVVSGNGSLVLSSTCYFDSTCEFAVVKNKIFKNS